VTLSKDNKQQIMQRFQRHPKDVGSTEVQVALLTQRINELNDHFKAHASDHHSRRGLLRIVGQRKRLLEYLRHTDIERYRKLIGELGLRK
jgi:small subunit ribosomal protein S15